MKHLFKDHIRELKRYQTSLGRDLENGYRLDRNEKVSNFSDNIISAVFGQFKNYSLSVSPESTTLYEKITRTLGINKNRIYLTSGVTEAIKILYESIANPGDNVIVLDPTYPMYMVWAKLCQLDYRKFTYDGDLKPDLNSLYKNMDAKTKFVMIPNPNLPIESCFTLNEIKEIANRCRSNGSVLVIDEAYYFFGAPTVIDLVDEYDNLIVLRSFSKAYGLAGIRLGFMVSKEENIEYFMNTRSLVESNTLSMKVAEYMLDHPELMQDHVKEVKEGSQYLQKELTKLGLRWFGGNVTNGILIFLNNGNETKDLVTYLKEKKIYIRGSFEPPYNISVRVSIGPRDIMAQFIESLKGWLAQRNK